MKKKIPFIVPHLPSLNEFEKDFLQIYRNGIFTNMGPFEKSFEKACAKFLKTPKVTPSVVALSNATIALTLALKALNPKRPIILLPSFTFPATLEAILWCGLKPVFVDIDIESWSMPLSQQTASFIKGGKVGGVLYGNPHGIPGDIKEWIKITNRYSLPLLIDSAAGMGSKYPDGTPMGLKGSAEIISLHATKAFGIGEGGLLITKNKALANKVQKMKNFGFDKNHVVQILGTNAKLPEFSSVIALHLLKKYRKILSVKKRLMKIYIRNLNDQIKIHNNTLLSSGQYFPILFPTSKLRTQKEEELSLAGVGTRRYYYPPLHRHPVFKSIPRIGSLRNTESVAQRTMALPLHLDLTEADVERITKIINK